MVDPDPGYRPRRAIDEPPAADVDEQPAAAAPDPPPRTDRQPPASPDPDTDGPPPLYRDEVAGAGPGPAGTGAHSLGSAAPTAPGEETRIVRPLNFRQRRPAPADEDATTVLPRTASGARRPVEDLDAEDSRRRLLGPRGALALKIGALVAVVVVGLAILYGVRSVGTPTGTPPAGSSAPAAGPTTPGGAEPTALLGEEMLLGPATARPIDAGRIWKVATTSRGAGSDDPTAACLSTDPDQAGPAADLQVTRVLSSTGRGAPSALHQASAYAAPQDAAQAFAVAAKSFGTCAAPGSYIYTGGTVGGLGDQATGLVANVVTGGKTQWHTIVLARTGRVLDVVDAAQPGKPLDLSAVAKATAALTASQCTAAGGPCGGTATVRPGPPPLGGDVPGSLSTGDLPPAGRADESWVATPAEAPSEDFLGSQCETVTWTRTGATSATSRVYLVPSSTKFGLNDIVLTMKTPKAATDFAAKIRADLASCSKRQLTATVSEPHPVAGVGAARAVVSGWTATVSQKSTDGTQRYRVGVVSAGKKVAYTFLNPLPGGYDLTSSEWDRVTVRAGQRMTQVP